MVLKSVFGWLGDAWLPFVSDMEAIWALSWPAGAGAFKLSCGGGRISAGLILGGG